MIKVTDAHSLSAKDRRRGIRVSVVTVANLSRSTEVEIVEAREVWSEYRLGDGTVLRVKPIMIAITRVEGAETTTGEPVYNMKSTLVTDVRGGETSPDLG